MAFCLKSKDSGASLTTVRRILILTLMGAFFITPCWCSPIKKQASVNDPWWCQPCKEIHKTRHSRDINDPLETAFHIAIVEYKNSISKYVQQLHTKLHIGNMTKKQLKKNNWLPRKRFFKTLRKNDEKILPELYRQVQIYAVTIERLMKMEIRTQDASFNAEHRKNTLEVVKGNLHNILCETRQEIAEKRLKEPKNVAEGFVDEKKIPSVVVHITEGLLKDFTILKDYQNFLQKCYGKIFGKVSKKRQIKGDKVKSKKRTLKSSNKKVNDS